MEKLPLSCAVIWFTQSAVSATWGSLRFNRKIERFGSQLIRKVNIFPSPLESAKMISRALPSPGLQLALPGCGSAAGRKGCSSQGTGIKAGNARYNCISVLVAAIVAAAGKVATEHLIAVAGSTRGSMFSCNIKPLLGYLRTLLQD